MTQKRSLANALSADEKKLLAHLLAEEGITYTQTDIPAQKERNNLPVSYAQRRLLLLEQIDPDTPRYNQSAALRLRGHLDVTSLSQSLNWLVQRHEVFRTSFMFQGETAVQKIASRITIPLPFIDMEHLPEQEREAAALNHARKIAQEPFSLTEPPLLRVCLFRLADMDHLLAVVMHHLVCDGWSVPVLARELNVLYETAISHTGPPTTPLPIQYADYAVWEQETKTKEALTESIAYWQQTLTNAPTQLKLPTDFSRPQTPSLQGATFTFKIDQGLLTQLNNIAQRNQATLFMTLLTAFKLLLHRYTHQNDILVGTPIANRAHHQVESLIGFFANTLVLRSTLSEQQTFCDYLQQVRQITLAAYDHQDVPFEMLLEHLSFDRHLNFAPFFQVMIVFQQAFSSLTLPGLQGTLQELDIGISRFDLTLICTEFPDHLQLALTYDIDLFQMETIKRLAQHWLTMLQQIVFQPDVPMYRLEHLSEIERIQELAWNDTAQSYPEVCIQRLFEQQVVQTPEAVALIQGDQTFTYAELNQRANQLAAILVAHGIGPESFVGLSLPRSFNLFVAILAILKSGAAYVPLDPAYPMARLIYILDNASIEYVISDASVQEQLPPDKGTVINLSIIQWQDMAQPYANPKQPDVPAHAAYLLYTSGSTGLPKGVLVTHQGIGNLAQAQIEHLGVTAVDRIYQFASLNFDASVSEIFMAFLSGAALVIDAQGAVAGAELTTLLNQYEVTIVTLPPTILATLSPQDLPTLQTVLVAGEACPAELAQHWAQQVRLFNAYGPTETTVCATMSAPYASTDTTVPPIGTPIANFQVHVLDQYGNSVPTGIPGELYIAGVGLARGYWLHPRLTAERFLPNPFSQTPGDRLYRTGDLARRRTDGTLEFLGRVDHQVKVRGVRIEPAEVTAVLQQHPQLKDALVIATVQEDEPTQLVGYLVPHSKNEVNIDEVRAFLHQQLPTSMVPAHLCLIEAFPLSPNGKIDRQALPDPAGAVGSEKPSYIPPRTGIEIELVRIWEHILNKQPIGIQDNFFELGGNSLVATQIASQVKKQWSIDLPLRVLFVRPQISQLAAWLRDQQGEPLGLTTIPALPPAEVYPLSFAQERLWFLEQFVPDEVLYNTSMMVEMSGQLHVHALEKSINFLLQRHTILRTTIVLVEGRPQQRIAPYHPLTVRQVDAQAMVSNDFAHCIKEESLTPFDLTQGPLLRAVLYRLAEERIVLLLVMHHMVCDAWSADIFVREIQALYAAFIHEQASPLPPLTIQYTDFAQWQRQQLEGSQLEKLLQYWKTQIPDPIPVLELPADFPLNKFQSFEGATERFVIPPETTAGLRQLGHKTGTTLFMTMLAAFQVLLSRYSGQTDILVGTPIANRNHADIEALIGFFVNTLVIRGNLSGNPEFSDFLTQIRETTLAAYAHQDLPFEILVKEVQPERDLRHHPLVRVVFAVQNAPLAPVNLEGLTVRPISPDLDTARFDLECHIWPTQDVISGFFVYRTALFEKQTIQRLCQHFLTLLNHIIAEPKRRVLFLPILSSEERTLLLEKWNQTLRPYPRQVSVPALFTRQAVQTPDAIAVQHQQQTLTYAELEARSNQLARQLQAEGVGLEDVVALSMDKSLEMVVGFLGILKAGAAYLPIDPATPLPRVRFMLADGQSRLLLTQSHLRAAWEDLNLPILCLDRGELSSWHDGPLQTDIAPHNLAYIMYTSGSTGQPKGIEIVHRGITRLVRNTNYADFSSATRMLQFSNIAFDAATLELWGPLLNGGQLVLYPQPELDLDLLAQMVVEHEINTLFLTTGLFHLMTEERPDALSKIQLLMTGGDVLSPRHAQLVIDLLGSNGRFINLYGPTENTTLSTYSPIETLPELTRSIPIGYTVANTTTYILDQAFEPVPIGVVGELYLGGDGLARGYLLRPALTAEKFVPNPFAQTGGERLYATGDMVRYLADGQLEFKGRVDNQVKIRGFRIELNEIEATLLAHPLVHSCIVTLYQGETSDQKQILAYVIPTENQGHEDLAARLRDDLAQSLPPYMTPASIILLDYFPLTPSGKVDRHALLVPTEIKVSSVSNYEAPRNEIERQLVVLWHTLLDVSQISVYDNFFELGGHSLLAVQHIAQLRQMYEVELNLRSLFEVETLADLAELIAAELAVHVDDDMLALLEQLSPEEVAALLEVEKERK